MGASPKAGAPPTPLPKWKLLGVFLINLTLGFQINVVWPFLPFMVDRVRHTKDESALFVGILASVYFWAQFASSFVWADLATRIGRRRCLMLGLVSVGVTFLGFGFSTSFAEALVWRALTGLLNGNVPIIKAYMATITDSSNQARGMSILALSWGLGSAVGPLLGGFLAEPAVVYADSFSADGVFGRYPYLLPCLAITSMSVVALLACVILLPADTERVGLCCGGGGGGGAKGDPAAAQGSTKGYSQVERDEEAAAAEEEASLLNSDDDDADDQDEEGAAAGKAGRSIYKGDAAVLRKGRGGGADGSQQPLLTWWTIFSTRSTATACMAYVYTALIFIIYDEMFPVFGKTDVAQGGLSFTAEDIGSALSVGGVVLIIYQMFIFPNIVKRFGLINVYRLGTRLTLLLMVIFPFVHLLAVGDSFPRALLYVHRPFLFNVVSPSQHVSCAHIHADPRFVEHQFAGRWSALSVCVSSWAGVSVAVHGVGACARRWVGLIALSMLRMVSSANCFVGSMIIVNNSVDGRNLNRVNGVCQALASLSRAIMPIGAGALWSSLLDQPWPIQPHGLYALHPPARGAAQRPGPGRCSLAVPPKWL
jgi:hypothetical protein